MQFRNGQLWKMRTTLLGKYMMVGHLVMYIGKRFHFHLYRFDHHQGNLSLLLRSSTLPSTRTQFRFMQFAFPLKFLKIGARNRGIGHRFLKTVLIRYMPALRKLRTALPCWHMFHIELCRLFLHYLLDYPMTVVNHFSHEMQLHLTDLAMMMKRMEMDQRIAPTGKVYASSGFRKKSLNRECAGIPMKTCTLM